MSLVCASLEQSFSKSKKYIFIIPIYEQSLAWKAPFRFRRFYYLYLQEIKLCLRVNKTRKKLNSYISQKATFFALQRLR